METSTRTSAASEREARIGLAVLHRIVALRRWDDHIYTHLSMRVPGEPGHMLLSPLGMLFSEVTASSLVKTTLDGIPVDDTSAHLNRGAVVIHGGVYAGVAGVHCVAHLHTIANVALSASNLGLLPISQPALGLTGKIAYHDYEGLAIDFDERSRLVRAVERGRVVVLRNHGSLVCAPSIEQAHDDMYIFERACEMQVAALSAGVDRLVQCSDQMARATAAAFDYDPEMGRQSWNAVLRRVSRESPGFEN